MKAAAALARLLFCLALVAGGAVVYALSSFKQAAAQDDVISQNLAGVILYEAEEYTEAVKQFRLAAEQGYAESQTWLGYAYAEGKGVKKDEMEAVKWFRLALKQGDGRAQFMLAKAYEEGRGVEKNEAEAVKRYRLAAEQGIGGAEYRVGQMYEEGRFVERDEVEAFKWFHRASNGKHDDARKKLFEVFYPAAERGDAYAQYEIGMAYFYGEGAEKDQAEGLNWFHLAAEQRYVRAQYELGGIYDYGEGDIEADQAEAAKWYHRAAEQGYAMAQAQLGYAYAEGKGVKMDKTEAVKWWHLAAKQRHAAAQRLLGSSYERGRGVSKNLAEAVRLYRLSAENGSYQAPDILGRLYLYDDDVVHDYREAYIWYSVGGHGDAKSAKAKLTADQIESADEEVQKIKERIQKRREEKEKAEEEAALAWRRANVGPDLRRKGDAYYKGKGVLPSYKEAAKWWGRAAEWGDAEAQYRLGLMYAEGKRGIEQNHVEAYIWLALAGVNDTGEIGEQAASLREKVEENLTDEQFEQAQAEATERLGKIKAKQ